MNSNDPSTLRYNQVQNQQIIYPLNAMREFNKVSNGLDNSSQMDSRKAEFAVKNKTLMPYILFSHFSNIFQCPNIMISNFLFRLHNKLIFRRMAATSQGFPLNHHHLQHIHYRSLLTSIYLPLQTTFLLKGYLRTWNSMDLFRHLNLHLLPDLKSLQLALPVKVECSWMIEERVNIQSHL